MKQICTIYLCLNLCYSFSQHLSAGQPPGIILAMVYKEGIDISQYLVSEKLDGVRAYWNGKELISRQGNVFHSPDWFTEDFPLQALDGELWLGHRRFEELLSIVRKKIPEENRWHQVKYMVFELPHATGAFAERYEKIKRILASSKNSYIHPVTQNKCANHTVLSERLEIVVSTGGEGLMLHKASSLYKIGRTRDLLKVKPYQDDEAVVISHLPGKGKYRGKMGSVEVVMEDGIKFRIGSGFSDHERENPPPIGSMITFTYHGKTINNIPRFASFLRVRKDACDN